MLEVVASARPTFDPAEHTLTLATPPIAASGDVLLAIVVHENASTFTTPSAWIDLGAHNIGGITAHAIAHMIDDGDSASIVIATQAIAGDEMQGALVVLRGVGALPLLVEATGSLAFAATLAPGSAAVSSLQAINLALGVWSAAGAHTLAAPAGFDAIDAYSTALVASRTLLVASRRTNATGALGLGAASSDTNASGSAFSLVLRDALPLQPAELVDLVPGNIGLLGTDNRPPREAS